ncbi:hypothetical protein BGW39_004642 [Mortierella sp. 14UC]|nr:hypothetical protein BGW39_004642 [Mortierella sp. 14UC]
MQQAIRGYFSSSQVRPALSHRVVLVGAPGGGKTTLLNRLRLAGSSAPTAIATTTTLTAFGVTAENVTIDGRHLNIWDIGIPWQRHTLNCHIGYEDATVGIVCVVDSANIPQLEQTKAWLFEMYEDLGTHIREAVLLVFANKQDRTDAMSVVEHHPQSRHPIPCSAQ